MSSFLSRIVALDSGHLDGSRTPSTRSADQFGGITTLVRPGMVAVKGRGQQRQTRNLNFEPSPMRQSVATTRSSHGAALNSAAASAKLLEKKKEYEAVAALDRVAALYLARMEGLAEDCDIMAIAGEGTLDHCHSVPFNPIDGVGSSWTSP